MESSNRCTKCNGKYFTLKLHQSYKSLWGNKRGRTKEIHKELQDLDLEGSPHKERDLIGEDVDLDLLYLSLKGIQESWEGEGDSKLKEVSNGGQNRARRDAEHWGRRGVFIAPQNF